MGRPLNKRLFGKAGVGPTAGGNEIKVNFHNGTAVKEGYIVKQKGSKRFVCEEIGTAGLFTCTLTTGKLPAALAEGEMAIAFKMDDGETYTVSKIAGRKATLSAPSGTGANAFDGKSVAWNFSTSTADGAAQVEEAGDDNTLVGADDTDFTEDA
mgnify:CR=1 FL=1|jgi:hypothetical protein|tara:strand:+ start:257 stop:718 length:462 start_codon:yes stop_codon:yes gene_type:complete